MWICYSVTVWAILTKTRIKLANIHATDVVNSMDIRECVDTMRVFHLQNNCEIGVTQLRICSLGKEQEVWH